MPKANNKIRDRFLLLFISIITIELCPYILSPIVSGQSFSRSEIQAAIKESDNPVADGLQENTQQNTDEYLGDHILHPYFGFVSIPYKKRYNRFSFPGVDPLSKRSDDTITVCVMGGSVAMGLHKQSSNTLRKGLKKIPQYKDKELRIVLFALGGFKQPQQLMALNYFLALGAEYDVVINLDGFNEIVLPYSDNLPLQVHPNYPRHWNLYARKGLDSKTQIQLSRQIQAKEDIEKTKRSFLKWKVNYSNFGLLLWRMIHNKQANKVYAAEAALREQIQNSEADYQATGPKEIVTDTTAYFAEQAAFWRRSSSMIHAISESHGFDYFHFLQPNQYVPNSKSFTKEELETAYAEGKYTYKTGVQLGYPMLIEEGTTLINDGIAFTDLTSLYTQEKRTVYSDRCCHFNQLGYDIMAEKIATIIANSTNPK